MEAEQAEAEAVSTEKTAGEASRLQTAVEQAMADFKKMLALRDEELEARGSSLLVTCTPVPVPEPLRVKTLIYVKRVPRRTCV